MGILSFHIITGRASTEQHFEREHIHITYIRVYGCNYSISMLLFISHCANVQIKLYRRYISLGKNTVDIGFGTICSCRHPLGSGNTSPADVGGVPYGRSHSFSLKDDYLHPFATGKLVTRFIFCAVVFLEINGERMKCFEIWSQKW